MYFNFRCNIHIGPPSTLGLSDPISAGIPPWRARGRYISLLREPEMGGEAAEQV